VRFLQGFLFAAILLSIVSCEQAKTCDCTTQHQAMVGRYSFHISPLLGRDIYMLDTLSGRVWIVVNSSRHGGTALEPVPFTEGGYIPPSSLPRSADPLVGRHISEFQVIE